MTLNICRPNTTEKGLPVMKYGRLDSAIGPDEVRWPAWKPELQQDM